jgi:hypothetical protein
MATPPTIPFAATADSNGGINQSVSFQVSDTIASSLITIAITTAGSGRTHPLSLRLSDTSGHIPNVNFQVKDNSTADYGLYNSGIVVMYRGQYTLTVTSVGYNSGESVNVQITFVVLDTNLGSVTTATLLAASGSPNQPVMGFGISEDLATNFSQELNLSQEIQVGDKAPYLKMSVSEDKAAGTTLRFDVQTQQVRIDATVDFTVYPANSPQNTVAIVKIGVEILGHPALVTSDATSIQFQFDSASVTIPPVISGVDYQEILKGYSSPQAFHSDMVALTGDLVNKTGPFTATLPFYISALPLPDWWDRVSFYDLTFLKFVCSTVTTNQVAIGYLFFVFSVQSTKTPVPCYCESSAGHEHADRGHNRFMQPHRHPVASSLHRRSKRAVAAPAVIGADPGAYLVAFATNAAALFNIAGPYVSTGNDLSTSTGGAVYASARFWYATTLDSIYITPNGIAAQFTAATEGSAKAAVRSRCGDVASVKAELKITVAPSTIAFALDARQGVPDPESVSIVAIPKVTVGLIDVTVKIPPVPDPLNLVGGLFNQIANVLARDIAKVIDSRVSLRLLTSSGQFRYIDTYCDDPPWLVTYLDAISRRD